MPIFTLALLSPPSANAIAFACQPRIVLMKSFNFGLLSGEDMLDRRTLSLIVPRLPRHRPRHCLPFGFRWGMSDFGPLFVSHSSPVLGRKPLSAKTVEAVLSLVRHPEPPSWALALITAYPG
jgi:hypothetical protein